MSSPDHLDRVTCEDAFRRIDDFLDRELSADEQERIRGHLEICAACASEFEFERSVIDGVKMKLRRVRVPSDLMAKISAMLARETGQGTDR